ncbi:MAG: hypothetical protein KIT58_17385 [Planctomycetota bacterium]|nr:hypothetical protein [Planctomycetota bacterium]
MASGCGRHLAAWALNLQAMAIGLVIAPGAVWRAFVRGRATRNLYGEPAHAPISDALLDARVDDLRARLGLDAPPPPSAALDRLTFAAWSGVALATLGLVALGPPLAVAAAVGWAVWLRPG